MKRDYRPLGVLLLLTVLAAAALQLEQGAWLWMDWMRRFMGVFLVVFSMFKLFDLPAFADGFQKYDLLAGPFRPYAYLYPFLELGLGLGYLAHWRPTAVCAATLALMSWSALGVVRSLSKGLNLECACMGTVLKVPLSTVTLTEDLAMALMAGWMLLSA